MTDKENTAELGDRVRDRISGISGIVTGCTEWLYGCRRIVIQAEDNKDGKPVDTFCIDEPQAEIIEKGVIKPSRPAAQAESASDCLHWPRNDPGRGHETARR